MTPRLLLHPALAAFIVCSPGIAAPPEGKPVLVPLWKKTTEGLGPEDDLFAEHVAGAREVLRNRNAKFLEDRRKSGMPLIPPATPIAHGNFVVCANDASIAQFALRKTDSLSGELQPGASDWTHLRSFGLQQMVINLGARATTDKWISKHTSDGGAALVFNRTLCVAFSLDNEHVHFVDELAFLPPAIDAKGSDGVGVFNKPRLANRVTAANLDTGKLVISLPYGYRFDDPETSHSQVFVGTPLAIKDDWLLVSERERSLGVSRLSRQKWSSASKKVFEKADEESVLWQSDLLKAPHSLVDDTQRRIHAIHLVQAGDLILCPTHLGRVVAVEAKTGKIKWTHEYAPLDAKRFPTFAPEWVVVPPVVVGDKYIYAPADFPELLCLNVADGTKVWSVKKGDGLYPAVVGEQVLVVGEKTLRSLNLKDGSEQWKLDLPGLPCGRGAMLGDKYLLPVSEPKTWRGMIALVDVKAGKITEVLKPDKDEPIGNLVVHQEFLISQTLTEIAVFPIRK